MTTKAMQSIFDAHHITTIPCLIPTKLNKPCIHAIKVREDYTENGKPGFTWITMNPAEWSLKELLRWLGC